MKFEHEDKDIKKMGNMKVKTSGVQHQQEHQVHQPQYQHQQQSMLQDQRMINVNVCLDVKNQSNSILNPNNAKTLVTEIESKNTSNNLSLKKHKLKQKSIKDMISYNNIKIREAKSLKDSFSIPVIQYKSSHMNHNTQSIYSNQCLEEADRESFIDKVSEKL